MVYFIIITYLSITFLSSLLWYKKGEKETPENYFLANRGLGSFVLFFTMVATNFSAFFFLGFAGEGYRIGYSYYAMMAAGTALAALTLYLVGDKVWKLGKLKSYITPVELVEDVSNSKGLKFIYLFVMVFFTLPYLAIQPIGAGLILSALTDNEIPYFLGAVLLTVFIIIYVFIGGMKSVALTDVKQGILMFVLMFFACYMVATDLGGLTTANAKVFELKPDLFTHQGANDYFTEKKWFSMFLLWGACLPMMPQIFTRFYIARELKHLKTTVVLYSAIPCILFLFPVIIGVLGHLTYPDLVGREADQILPKMLLAHTPEWMSALVMTGALAAFMSTLDSQLLALSTMMTRDIYVPYFNTQASLKQQVRAGRFFVVIFALIGLALAYNPFDSIFGIAKMAFTGLSMLFPTIITILYKKRYNKTACFSAILTTEILAFGFFMGIIPNTFLLGFEPVAPLLFINTLIIVLGSAFGNAHK